MGKGRMEAFSDGVIAIIITIMVLEIKIPHSTELSALANLLPVFFSYILSFIYVGIYWNNHHHLLQAVHRVNGKTLWANLHLLFWLSLFPFGTGWVGENNFATIPVAIYGVILLCAGIAYWILTQALLKSHGQDSQLAIAIGKDFKGKISVVIYSVAIVLDFVNSWLAFGLYAVVALLWFIPDRRIERTFNQ